MSFLLGFFYSGFFRVFFLCVYFTHKNVAQEFDKLKHCLDDIKKLSANKLKLYPHKSEFIIFESKMQYRSLINLLNRIELNHLYSAKLLQHPLMQLRQKGKFEGYAGS